ncbi:MAG: hypothetical protein HZB46_02465, partial [Solirubrobacterales bacterium]|nr:hypothetical protein [Solirubrobacterales bacterium]
MARYVLLPQEGIVVRGGTAPGAMLALPATRSTEERGWGILDGLEVGVVDATREDGPRLVEISDEAARAINASPTPVRALPEVEYGPPAPRPRPAGGATQALSTASATLRVRCEDAVTGLGVAGVHVIAFTSVARRSGDQGDTGADGEVLLRLRPGAVERLLAYPPPGYWGACRTQLTAPGAEVVTLVPADVAHVDALRRCYGTSRFDATAGVRVA